MIVVLTNNSSGAIEKSIVTYCKNFNVNLIFISSLDFLEPTFQIFDSISNEDIKINWRISSGQHITNNESTILINLIDYIDIESMNKFHPDDVEYIRHELFAYLIFASTQFQFGISSPSGNSLCNKFISMPLQLSKIRNAKLNCSTPKYYFADNNYFLLNKKVDECQWVKGNFYSYRSWRPNVEKKVEDENKYLFYERPKGEPILGFYFGGVSHFKYFNEKNFLSFSQKQLLLELANSCAIELNIFSFECIFFLNSESITFGSITGEIEKTSQWVEFERVIESFLKNPTKKISWTKAKNRRKPLLKKTGKPFICGILEDSCMAIISSYSKEQFLDLEKLNSTWNYSVSNGSISFYLEDSKSWIECRSLYLRPMDINDSPDHKKYTDFYDILNSIDISFIGSNENMQLNGSKPTQLINAFKAIKETDSLMKIPKTYIISGTWNCVEDLLEKHKNLIVKSISGIRSHVVDAKVFSKWNKENLKFGPHMFQELVAGEDLRIQVCGDFVDARVLKQKSETDYRYAKSRSLFEHYELEENIQKEALILAKSENNPLVGIDLIINKISHGLNDLYLLELNPSPAWSFFYNDDVKGKNKFANEITLWLIK